MIRPGSRDRGKLDPRQVIEAECGSCLMPKPVREYRFDPSRRWRFDLSWPVHRIAVEIDGGLWTGGRHVRGGGHERDAEKRNRATVLGWRVLTYSPQQVMRGLVRRDIQDIISRDGVQRANERIAAGLPTLPGRKRKPRPTVEMQVHFDQTATLGPQVLVDADPRAGYGKKAAVKLPENVWDD